MEYYPMPPAEVIVAASFFGKATAAEMAKATGSDVETIRDYLFRTKLNTAREVVKAGEMFATYAKQVK